MTATPDELPDAPEATGKPVKRLLTTGSRTWRDREKIDDILSRAYGSLAHELPNILVNDVVMISGACPIGADRMCEEIWESHGLTVERHPAQWVFPDGTTNKRAGFDRNEEMVNLGADLCVAFIRDESPGVSHTARLAEAAGIPTKRVTN